MAYDEDVLNSKLSWVQDEIRKLNTKKGILGNMRERLHDLQDIDVPVMDTNGKPKMDKENIVTKKEMPIDEGTNKKISLSRRNQIFDAVITEIDKISS